jgi:hypothetical protein
MRAKFTAHTDVLNRNSTSRRTHRRGPAAGPSRVLVRCSDEPKNLSRLFREKWPRKRRPAGRRERRAVLGFPRAAASGRSLRAAGGVDQPRGSEPTVPSEGAGAGPLDDHGLAEAPAAACRIALPAPARWARVLYIHFPAGQLGVVSPRPRSRCQDRAAPAGRCGPRVQRSRSVALLTTGQGSSANGELSVEAGLVEGHLGASAQVPAVDAQLSEADRQGGAPVRREVAGVAGGGDRPPREQSWSPSPGWYPNIITVGAQGLRRNRGYFRNNYPTTGAPS